MGDVVVVGSCMIDFVSYCPQLPKPGQTVHGHGFATGYGGKGANQIVAAARLAPNATSTSTSTFTIVAKVGDDEWGSRYVKRLKDERVDTRHVRIVPNQTTGIAQIMVSDAGENIITIVAGANDKLSAEDVDRAKDVVANAKVVVMQLETPAEAAVRAMELCTGVSILNAAPAAPHLPPKLYTSPTIFCVNETEAEISTGLPVANVDEGKAAIAKLLKDRRCNSVILTLGKEGALYASQVEPEPLHVAAPKLDKVVDTTGAGDAFVGALAWLLAHRPDLSIGKSLEIACRLAAQSVQKPGAQVSFSNAVHLEALFNDG